MGIDARHRPRISAMAWARIGHTTPAAPTSAGPRIRESHRSSRSRLSLSTIAIGGTTTPPVRQPPPPEDDPPGQPSIPGWRPECSPGGLFDVPLGLITGQGRNGDADALVATVERNFIYRGNLLPQHSGASVCGKAVISVAVPLYADTGAATRSERPYATSGRNDEHSLGRQCGAVVHGYESRSPANRLMSMRSKAAILSNIGAYIGQSSFVVPAMEMTATSIPLLPQKSE